MGSINQAPVPETSVSGRRVGIFGGSFNPIHLGHIALAQAAIDQQLVDEVWLLVSPLNPLKVNKTLLPEDIRLRLAKKALEGAKCIEASDFEFQLERPSYTWKTLEALETAYPEHTFSLIIGGDNWAIFDRWVKADLIRARYNIYVYPREGSEILPDAEGHMPTAVIDAPLYLFSSTDIRNAIAEGASDEVLATMLPKAIIDDCRRLYGSLLQLPPLGGGLEATETRILIKTNTPSAQTSPPPIGGS